MTDRVSIDTSPLRGAARGFASAEQSVRSQLGQLTNVVSAHSACFGQDRQGHKMHQQFNRLYGNYLGYINALARVYGGTAEGVGQMAESYEAAEDAAVRNAGALSTGGGVFDPGAGAGTSDATPGVGLPPSGGQNGPGGGRR